MLSIRPDYVADWLYQQGYLLVYPHGVRVNRIHISRPPFLASDRITPKTICGRSLGQGGVIFLNPFLSAWRSPVVQQHFCRQCVAPIATMLRLRLHAHISDLLFSGGGGGL